MIMGAPGSGNISNWIFQDGRVDSLEFNHPKVEGKEDETGEPLLLYNDGQDHGQVPEPGEECHHPQHCQEQPRVCHQPGDKTQAGPHYT